MKCGLMIRIDDSWVAIKCTEESKLSFAVGGGAEIPHISLSLRLRTSDAIVKKSTSEDIVLRAVWTTWGDKGYETDRNAPSGNPDTVTNLTFSDRLMNLRIRSVNDTKELASLSGGRTGTPAFLIEWTHHRPPYVYGFQLPREVMEELGFTKAQQDYFDIFRAISGPDRDFRVVTQSRGQLPDFLHYLTKTPVPTPPPYPLYDCRYYPGQDSFGRIKDVPSLFNRDIENHHCRREKGWVNSPPGFVLPNQILSMHQSAPLTFINEREYEVVKTGGLLREAQYQHENMLKNFNRRYSFLLAPASTLHGTNDDGMDGVYYAFLDLSPQEQNPNSSESLLLPEPGTPVKVRNTSHSLKSSALVRDPRSTTKDQDEWLGAVVSSQANDDGQKTFGENTVCIHIKRPNTFQAGGHVLQMTGFVEFGARNPPFAQTRGALRYAMYGNKDLFIPSHNRVKRLLLGYDNHILKYLRPNTNVPQVTELHLSSLQNVLNQKQLDALISSFTVDNSVGI